MELFCVFITYYQSITNNLNKHVQFVDTCILTLGYGAEVSLPCP